MSGGYGVRARVSQGYVLVCHAARAKKWCSIRRARYAIIVIFVVTSVFSLPFAFRYRTVWTPTGVNASNATTGAVFSAVHIEVSNAFSTPVHTLLHTRISGEARIYLWGYKYQLFLIFL